MVYARKSRAADSGELAQALFAIACLAAVIAFSFFVDTGGHGTEKQAAIPQGSGDDGAYTGSILFLPSQGNACRQSIIDNRTGVIRDNGIVACDAALPQSIANPTHTWPTARVDAIRDGFTKR
jgi:hypothetical protein